MKVAITVMHHSQEVHVRVLPQQGIPYLEVGTYPEVVCLWIADDWPAFHRRLIELEVEAQRVERETRVRAITEATDEC